MEACACRGLLVVASGLVLNKLVPGLGDVRGDMQVAHMVHATASIIMMSILVGAHLHGHSGREGALTGP